MPQLLISTETMNRMKVIAGVNHARDGDYIVNEVIDILEKKLRDLN